MPYADTDFFLALLKKEDWLKENAITIYTEYKNKIWTSAWTVVELLLISEKFQIDPERLVTDMFEMVTIATSEKDKFFTAAHLMKEYDLKTFDALHAASCGSDKIISSDSVFDKLRMERIKLEK